MSDGQGMFSPPWSSRNSESRPKKQAWRDMPLLEKVAYFGLFLLLTASLAVLCVLVWAVLSWMGDG